MNKYLIFILLSIGALTLSGCAITGWSSESEEEIIVDTSSEATNPALEQSSADARALMEGLTDIGSREPGSDEEKAAAEYIADAFVELGYTIEAQPFTSESDDWGTIVSENVIAIKEGLSSDVIIVGAHYDGVEDGQAVDDNASGVSVLLETAGLVRDTNTIYTIHFIAFGAEEAGLLGSEAYVDSLSADEIDNLILMINLDSISAGDIPYAYSLENEAGARDWAIEWANTNGYELETIWNVDLTDEDGYGTADYTPFQDAGIPWLYFEATNWSLGDEDGYTQVDPRFGDDGAIIHTEYDDIEYLDSTFPGRVDHHLDLFVNVLYHLLTQYSQQ